MKLGETAVRRRPPGRPSQEVADRLREICLRAALDTFLAKGYEGASLEQIARVANAGKTTFYRQFGNKAALFRLVAHQAIAKVRYRIEASLDTTGEPEHVLRQIIARLHAALTDAEYLAVLRMVIAETPRFPEVGEAMLAQDHFLWEPVEEYLRRAAADGKLDIPDPFAATLQLAGLAVGGARFLIKKPRTDKESQQQWVEAVLQFVLKAWEPRRGVVQKPKRKTVRAA